MVHSLLVKTIKKVPALSNELEGLFSEAVKSLY